MDTNLQCILPSTCGFSGNITTPWRTAWSGTLAYRDAAQRWIETPNNYVFTTKEKIKLLQRTGTTPEQWKIANNSEQVHSRITNWFSTWFFLDLNDCQPLHSTEDWQKVYNNKAEYDSKLKDVQVSDEHKTLL